MKSFGRLGVHTGAEVTGIDMELDLARSRGRFSLYSELSKCGATVEGTRKLLKEEK